MKNLYLNFLRFFSVIFLILHSSGCRVGWSDFVLFSNFETYAWPTIRCTFVSSNTKNHPVRPHRCTAHARQSFHCWKITGTLKINIFSENLHKPYIYQRTISKNKILYSILFNIFASKLKNKFCFRCNLKK